MNTWFVIPARAGSKRIPDKNLRDFCGKPLVHWTIALARSMSSHVLVTSDSNEVLKIASQAGASTIERTQAMANDEVHAAIAVEHALRACNKINPTDTIVTLLPTCPLRTSDDIREACRIYRDPYIAAASVISVCAGPPQNRIRTITEQGEVSSLEGVRAHPLSQNAAKTFIVNGAVFITSPDKLRQGFRAMPCFPYIMPVSRSIDIDTEEDWQMAERTFKAIFPG